MISRKFASRLLFFTVFLPLKGFSQGDSVKKSLLILPVITRSVETGFTFGAVGSSTFHFDKKDSLTRTSNQQAIVLYSLKKQLITALNGTIYFPKEKFILNDQVSFSYFPDKFWGFGKHAPDSAEENYTFKQCYVYLHFLTAVRKNLYLGVLYEYQNLLTVDYNKGGIFDKQNVTGRQGYKVSGPGLSIIYDNRSSAFSPDKGAFVELHANNFRKFLGSDYNFTAVVLDARKYIRTYRKQVLALQLYSQANFGNSVPLRNTAALGGANSMRGMYSGRYRDKDQLVLQAEYRVPIAGRFGAVAFAGAGDVGHTATDYSFNTLKYSYGAGVRFAVDKKEKLNIRVDYGLAGRGNSGLYFQLGEAF